MTNLRLIMLALKFGLGFILILNMDVASICRPLPDDPIQVNAGVVPFISEYVKFGAPHAESLRFAAFSFFGTLDHRGYAATPVVQYSKCINDQDPDCQAYSVVRQLGWFNNITDLHWLTAHETPIYHIEFGTVPDDWQPTFSRVYGSPTRKYMVLAGKLNASEGNLLAIGKSNLI